MKLRSAFVWSVLGAAIGCGEAQSDEAAPSRVNDAIVKRYDARPEVGIPVVVFHEICPDTCGATDTYGVSKPEFERILQVFERRGYTTIGIADFARAHRGDRTGLPARPLLVTFDDGRQDAYVGADDVLAKHQMRATMFVITNAVRDDAGYTMSWAQVTEAAASGRWDMQVHAHAGHVQVPVAPGATRPFYANRECTDAACTELEAHDTWRQRTSSDLDDAEGMLAAKLEARYVSYSFAVPFSDYGQGQTNDPLISTELRRTLDERFEVWFTQAADAQPMTSSSRTHEVSRFLLTNKLRAEDVDAWLARHEGL